MIKNIIREVELEACDFRSYFDCDGLSGHGDEYYNNLFIVSRDRWGRIGEWFSTQGKRYGLLKEFRENAVC